MSPRMQIVWRMLEGAKDAGDALMVAACQRLIVADRRGWRKYADPADWQFVSEFDAEMYP